ncbi:MAG: hypothetical protein IKB55_00790 [Clostridia bacterium]|nr:hypothetical protein [Clostridia bacterium]
MFKKVLSIILALTMIASLNIFALSGAEIKDADQTVLVGEGAGVETVLTKSGDTFKLDVFFVGPMNKVTGLQTGFKFDKNSLTYVGMETNTDFLALASDWSEAHKSNYLSSGYIQGGYTTTATNKSISIAAGEKLNFMTFTFSIIGDAEINSTNYEDFVSYNNNLRAGTMMTLNLSTSVSSTANPDIFSFDASGLDSYNLSINTPENGIAELFATTVKGGEKVTLNVTPAIGYYIDSVMAGEANITSSVVDVYRGGEIEYAPTADTAFTVTFAEIVVDNDVTTSTGMTGVDALTLPEVFKGKVNNEAVEDVSIAFGQVAPATGREMVGYGIYLTYADDSSDVTTMKPGVGPKFAANSKSADNQFGIIFEQLRPGSYNAQTYIEYTDGIVYGIKVPFTVE